MSPYNWNSNNTYSFVFHVRGSITPGWLASASVNDTGGGVRPEISLVYW